MFETFSDNQWQKLWEKLLFGQILFLPTFPLNTDEKKWAKFMSSDVMGSQHYIGGEGDF